MKNLRKKFRFNFIAIWLGLLPIMGQGQVLFIGSSSIEKWHSLPADFPAFATINAGVGGTKYSDLPSIFLNNSYTWALEPKQVVIYSGDNDLAAGESVADVLVDAKMFFDEVRERLPRAAIHIVSVKPSLLRVNLLAITQIVNERLASYARAHRGFDFVDVFTPMLTPERLPRPELFGVDGLHMNSVGYQLWTSLITPALTASSSEQP